MKNDRAVLIRACVARALLTASARVARAQILDVRELRPPQIAALDRGRTVVLVTGGILEEHGPYLPSYSDGYQTEFVAGRVAEAIAARPGWTVLRFPMIPLGAEPANDIGGPLVFAGSYPVRSSTLRAVVMDLLTDLGDQGFRWGFIVNLHGGPLHNRALDEAAQYFSETFQGRMVHLAGLTSVAGAVPADVFTPAQRKAEGFSVHADGDEHSRLLFLRPDLVDAGVAAAPPVTGGSLDDLASIASRPGWPGYWGTPAIASAAAGARAMTAIAQAACDAALKVLDGTPDSALPRVPAASMPGIDAVLARSLAHERDVEQRESAWLARIRR
jgi:creatinine amidohydrolase/Fe(II)-dependent formamide hydrolase-like protein